MAKDILRTRLIKKFLALKNFHNTRVLNSYVNSLEMYLLENDNDTELTHILLTVQANKRFFKTNNFDDCCLIADPIIEELRNKSNMSYLDLTILATSIQFTKTYVQAKDIAKKVMNDLENHAHKENRENTSLILSANMTMRLVYAYYIDANDPEQNVNPAEVLKMFDYYYQHAVAICEKYNLLTMKTVIDIRSNVIKGDCEAIDAGFRWLQKAKAYGWYSATQNEVVNFFSNFGVDITKWMLDVIAGNRARKLREASGKSIEDVAFSIDITPNALGNVERGLKGLKMINWFKLAYYFGVEASYLFPSVSKKLHGSYLDGIIYKLDSLLHGKSDRVREEVVGVAKAIVEFHKFG